MSILSENNKDFIFILIIVFIFGCFSGYFWRMSQEVNREIRAFETGQKVAIKEFKKVLQQENDKGKFLYCGFKIIPRNDGKYIIQPLQEE